MRPLARFPPLAWLLSARSAVGVEVNKVHRNRVIAKRIHVRVEHVQPSRSRDEFLARRASNDAAKAEAKKAGKEAKEVKKKTDVANSAAECEFASDCLAEATGAYCDAD